MKNMKNVFEGCEPKQLYDFLNDVFATPRPSGHEEKMAEYVIDFAKKRGLEYVTDEIHNILIRKPASAGMEEVPPVLLEGHMDMVTVKAPDSFHDFINDPIDLIVENGWVHGNQTTLGADNGCAVAIMLAILDNDKLVHPPLECLFTVQEELGMLGAEAFDLDQLHSRRVIGLDAGSEGVFRKGVSSKYKNEFKITIERETVDGDTFELCVSGLRGGSPSDAISLDRACAIKLMGRVLYGLVTEYGARINLVDKSVNPGVAENCKAVITISNADKKKITEWVKRQQGAIRNEYAESDPDLTIEINACCYTEMQPITEMGSLMVARFLYLMPYGAMRRVLERGEEPRCFFVIRHLSTDVEKINVKTMISTDKRNIGIALQEEIKALSVIIGAEVVKNEFDFGWDPEENSEIREVMRATYIQLFGCEPIINVSHGGNDCVIIKRKIPEFDVVTTAATYPDYHTIHERLDLLSFEKVYYLIERTLENLCKPVC